jgi:hypothetical protein
MIRIKIYQLFNLKTISISQTDLKSLIFSKGLFQTGINMNKIKQAI